MPDIESLKTALAVSPDNVPLLLMLAHAQMETFALDDARATLERVIVQDPNHPEARTAIAQVLDLNGHGSEAILRIEQVCGEAPDYAPAWMLRAKLSLNEGSAGEAREHYQRAVTGDPSLADPELLKRIRQAGRKSPGRGDGGSDQKPTIQAQGSGDGWQAGAFMDPDADAEGEDAIFSDYDPFDDDDDDNDGASASLPPGARSPLDDDLETDFVQKADVDFQKVGGMDAVKEDIRMKILYPMENKELFEAYGKKVGGGVLLYGPPGCGKTLISRATAGEIDAKFISVGLHQILDMWIGKSEEKLHEIFELARRNAPSVLFFDEVDALAADRKDMRTSGGRTLINQFLAELDGQLGQNDGVLVLGATNAPWHLDSAFLRPGRFDRLIFVPPPDEPARAEIVRIMAEGKPVAGLDPAGLAKRTNDFSGADIKAVFDQAIEASLGEAMKAGKIVPVTAKQLAKTAKQVKPSTRKWFESAKNYALYANQSGFYDDVLEYLGINK
jgi:transitional endoplasmic reticulum ATPase